MRVRSERSIIWNRLEWEKFLDEKSIVDDVRIGDEDIYIDNVRFYYPGKTGFIGNADVKVWDERRYYTSDMVREYYVE